MTGKETVYFTRIKTFSAGHRLYSDQLSKDENKQLYGKCFNENGHGHNYTVHVTVCGEKNPETHLLMYSKVLDQYMQESFINEMDHKFLDKDVEFFKTSPTSLENMAVYIWNRMQPCFEHEAATLYEVKVYSGDANCAMYRG